MKALLIALSMVGAAMVSPVEARSCISIGVNYSVHMGHRPPRAYYEYYEEPVVMVPYPCHYYQESYYVVERRPYCCHNCCSRCRMHHGVMVQRRGY
ncbi:MAG: hypothetical protein JSR80_05815 [Verrucomicrobia bacterium]|nr:hypothetical protein [Verrucomicrobiota bacterium]